MPNIETRRHTKAINKGSVRRLLYLRIIPELQS